MFHVLFFFFEIAAQSFLAYGRSSVLDATSSIGCFEVLRKTVAGSKQLEVTFGGTGEVTK